MMYSNCIQWHLVHFEFYVVTCILVKPVQERPFLVSNIYNFLNKLNMLMVTASQLVLNKLKTVFTILHHYLPQTSTTSAS